MGALSSKLRSLEGGRLMFWCPGCDGAHQVAIRDDGQNISPAWGYNGNPEKPTFTPSILVAGGARLSDEEYARAMAGEKINTRPIRCHSFVTDGRIQFLNDCTHALAGQTVDLPDFDEVEQ